MNQALQDVIEHRRTTQDQAIRSATFGAGPFLYATEVHGFGSCPMIGFDAVPVASEFSLFPDEIPVLLSRLVERLPITGRKNAACPLTEVLSFA